MRFGIFYEHQLPRPWGEDDEHQLLKDALEQVELADRLGIDYVWQVEHHFLEEYSHSSAPEVFLAACSQRTSRIRLGHGIVQLPAAVNHPARVAERIAMLDLVSDGLGALCFSMCIEPEDARSWTDAYYSLVASEACVPAGFAITAEVAVVQSLLCHEDEATAVERGLDGNHFIGYTLNHYYRFGDRH